MTMDSRVIDGADGIPLALIEAGEGNAIVFIHGTGAEHNRWQAVTELLSERFCTVSYDRRGRGNSGDSSAYSVAHEIRDLLHVLNVVGEGKPVNVVAHSFGALLALAAALQEPQAFSHLVLYEAPVAFPDTEPFVEIPRVHELEQVMANQGASEATAFFLEHFPGLLPPEIEQLKQAPSWTARCASAGTLARELRAAYKFSLRPGELQAIPVPTLILLGGASRPAFHQSAHILQENLPDSQLRILAGETHRAMDTDPTKVAGLIAQFLGNTGSSLEANSTNTKLNQDHDVQCEIRHILQRVEDSVHNIDYDAVTDLIPDDGIYFGSVATMARGYDELKEKQFMLVWPNVDAFSIVPDSIAVHAAGTLAWATCLFESTARGAPAGQSGTRKGRMTFVFEQRDGRWVMVHSHDSLNPTPPRAA